MTDYYVDSAATGTGTGLSEANAFTTIDAAMNIMATAGTGPHTVYVKATAQYDENANIDTAGGLTTPITFEGYTTTPGDNGLVDWTNSSGSALTDATSATYYVFKNFDINGASSHGAFLSGVSGIVFFNCKFRNNAGDGFQGGTTSYCAFINCEFTNNGSEGYLNTGTDCIHVGCIYSGNASIGLQVGGGDYTLVYKCVVFNNSATFAGIRDLGDFSKVLGCTVDMENASQLAVSAGSGKSITALIDNILYDGSYGAQFTDTGKIASMSAAVGYNLINSMATGDYNGTVAACISAGITTDTDVTTAPAFTDEAGDDYRVRKDSPAVGGGLKPGGIT